MSDFVVTINGDASRQKAHSAVDRAPEGYRISFSEPKRSTPQNARMWAMLEDVASQVKHHGKTLSKEDWKVLFSASWKGQLRIVPSLDGYGFIQLGVSTSKMSVEQMTELMTLIQAYGDTHGVTFREPFIQDDAAA